MNKKTIWGNTLVKNEGRFIWFSLMSVVDYLDKILIWDTGSTDSTVEIIKLVMAKYPQKIIFKEIGTVDADGLTLARQKMLEQTKSDWLFLLDGDEVWEDKSIKEVVETIQRKGDNLYGIVNPVYNLVGDIYHYQDQNAGNYQILGKKGHFNIRAINRSIPGLHIKNTYPLEGFFDNHEILLQEESPEKLVFLNAPIFHFSHLSRSTFADKNDLLKKRKIKYEIGQKFPKSFNFPEVFSQPYPSIVPSPWEKATLSYKIRAYIETPLKKIKRRI